MKLSNPLQRTELFTRQQEVLNAQKTGELHLTIIGVGALGSLVAITAVKMGFTKITLFDDDIVNLHNLPNQFYGLGDLDKPKVEALRDTLVNYGAEEVNIHYEKFTEASQSTEIVISCVDNMETRQKLFHTLRNRSNLKYYIETRMGLLNYQMFVLPASNKGAWLRYQKYHLYPDNEASPERCTAKSILFTPMGLAEKVGVTLYHIAREEMINWYGITCDLTDMSKTGVVMFYDRTASQEEYFATADKGELIEA